MKKNLIFYKGATQFENLGDLLINKTLLKTVSAYGETIIDEDSMPEDYCRKLLSGIDNVTPNSKVDDNINFQNLFYRTLIKNFFSKSFIIYFLESPGHHFSNKPKPKPSDFWRLIKKKVLKLLGCQFLRLGVTLGPYSNEMFQFHSKVSKSYYKILVRDYISLQNVKNFNFSNYSYIPDLAWAYKHKKLPLSHKSIESGHGEQYIVLSFRDCIEGYKTDKVYFSQLLVSIEKIFKGFEGFKFVLTYQVEYDKNVCKAIYEQFKMDYNMEFEAEILSLDKAFNIYSKAKSVISNRLHVLMLAIDSQTLPIALTDIQKHIKLVAMFKDEKMDECVIGINSFNIEDVKNTYDNKDRIILDFAKIRSKNAEHISQSIHEIFMINN